MIGFTVRFPWGFAFRRGGLSVIERVMRRAARWRGYVTVFDEVVK